MDFLKSNLKHLRTKSGLTQLKLADVLDVSRDNIASYERGTLPPVDVIHRMVNYFHIRFNDLIEKDLSKFESPAAEEVISESDSELSQNESSSMSAHDNDRRYRLRNIESLERVIHAQELTIRAQRETIDALKRIINSKK